MHEKFPEHKILDECKVYVNAECKGTADTITAPYQKILDLYKKRQISKDDLEKQLIKLIMNSAYGMLTQKEFKNQVWIPTDALDAAYQNGDLDRYMGYIE